MLPLDQFSSMDTSAIDRLLQNGEWELLWQSTRSLPLLTSMKLLPIIQASGWLPADPANRQRLINAFSIADEANIALAVRDHSLIPHEQIDHGGKYIRVLALSPDGRLIATGTGEPDGPGIYLWSADSHDLVAAHELDLGPALYRDGVRIRPAGAIDQLTFSPCGRYLAAGDGFVLHVLDVANGWFIDLNRGRSDAPRPATGPGQRIARDPAAGRFCFLRDRLIVATWGAPIRWFSYNTATWRCDEMQIAEQEGWVFGMAVSPDQRLVASGVGRNPPYVVHIHDLDTGHRVARLIGHSESVRSVQFSPDGRFLASASYDGTVRLWETNRWSEIARFPEKVHRGTVHFSCAFSPDGRLFTAADLRQTDEHRRIPSLALLTVPDLKVVQQLRHSSNKPDHISFNPAGTAVAAGTCEGRSLVVQLWSAPQGTILATFENSRIAQWSLDGQHLYVDHLRNGHGSTIVKADVRLLDVVLRPLESVKRNWRHELKSQDSPEVTRLIKLLSELLQVLRQAARS